MDFLDTYKTYFGWNTLLKGILHNTWPLNAGLPCFSLWDLSPHPQPHVWNFSSLTLQHRTAFSLWRSRLQLFPEARSSCCEVTWKQAKIAFWCHIKWLTTLLFTLYLLDLFHKDLCDRTTFPQIQSSNIAFYPLLRVTTVCIRPFLACWHFIAVFLGPAGDGGESQCYNLVAQHPGGGGRL